MGNTIGGGGEVMLNYPKGCTGCIYESNCEGQCGKKTKERLLEFLVEQRNAALEELRGTPWIKEIDLSLISQIIEHSEMIGRLQ